MQKNVELYRRLLRRREAAAQASWSIATLDRRERTDPNIPERIGTGPNGGAPWGYWSDQWDAYLAGMPTGRAAAADPECSRTATELARRGVAKRRADADVAPCAGAETTHKRAPKATVTPTVATRKPRSVASTSALPANAATQQNGRAATDPAA